MADEDTSLIETNSIVLDDNEDSNVPEDAGISNIVTYVYGKYGLAKDYRKTAEQSWLKGGARDEAKKHSQPKKPTYSSTMKKASGK